MPEYDNSDSLDGNENLQAVAVPVAELMRRKKPKKTSDKDSEKQKDEDVDLDDEIKRLEAELAEDSDSDSSGSSSDGESDEESGKEEQGRRKRVKFGVATVVNPDEDEHVADTGDKKEGILCMSECASDSIVPLPKSSLPTSKTRVLKIDREMQGETKGGSKKKRKRSKGDESGDNNNSHTSDGLRDAVKEVLSGYVARSSEKIPFYCRVCSHQCSNEEDFIAHKQTEFHKVAVQVERKATYCKLCRKQLTSIVQMKEHLKSRPHKERLDQVQARQRGGGFRPGGIRGRGPGRGRGGRMRRNERNSIPSKVQSRRQWT